MLMIDDVALTAPHEQVLADKLEARLSTAKKLVAAWYPRINTLLLGTQHPLPGPTPQVVIDAKPISDVVPAYAEHGVIHLWADYIADQPEDDFEGMVIHELTHVNQNTKMYGPDSAWVAEGIADYVRHKYFAKDIESNLHMGSDGSLKDYAARDPYFYSLQQQHVNLRVEGYQASYTVASTFLYWLELHSNKHIVPKLSIALEHGTYTSSMFTQLCGRSLDSLWKEFVVESERLASPVATATNR